MCETFEACFEKLEGLTSKELDRSVVELVAVENRNVALVIAHLSEISRRKAELEHGYRSLFDYGVRRLGLSEGSVALRVQVANVSRRFPEILSALAEGRISLSVAGRLAPHLREDNVATLVADCAGMTKRVVEEYLVRLKLLPVFEPSIRKLPDLQANTGPELPPQPAPLPSLPPAPTPALLAPATPELFNFRFSGGCINGLAPASWPSVLPSGGPRPPRPPRPLLPPSACMRRSSVLGAEASFGECMLRLAQFPIVSRHLQATARPLMHPQEDAALKSQSPKCESRPGEVATNEPATSRHVPAAVRDRVFQRASYQCQFTCTDGTRCTARTGLQVEHTVPFGKRPEHDESTLQILCARHNRLRAEQAYGAGYVQAKIATRRLQAHGLELEGVPDGELLGKLEAKRGEVGCRNPGNIHV